MNLLPQTPRRLSHGALLTLLGLTVLCSSCSKGPKQKPVFPVQGKVLFKGKPIAPAVVVFHSKNPGQTEHPVGKSRQDGVYKLSTYSDKDGAPVGEYAVTVTWSPLVTSPDGESEAGPNRLPPRYEKPESSGLSA